MNAKAQRPGVCNAAECLLVHRAIAASGSCPRVAARPGRGGRRAARRPRPRSPSSRAPACPRSRRARATSARSSSTRSWRSRVVRDLDGALEHIARYGSRHTEAIVTRDLDAARALRARGGRVARDRQRLHPLQRRRRARARAPRSASPPPGCTRTARWASRALLAQIRGSGRGSNPQLETSRSVLMPPRKPPARKPAGRSTGSSRCASRRSVGRPQAVRRQARGSVVRAFGSRRQARRKEGGAEALPYRARRAAAHGEGLRAASAPSWRRRWRRCAPCAAERPRTSRICAASPWRGRPPARGASQAVAPASQVPMPDGWRP